MWNINTIEYYSATSKDEILSGGFNAALLSATDEEKDYQDMICLGRKGGRFSQRGRAQSLSLQGLLLGSSHRNG